MIWRVECLAGVLPNHDWHGWLSGRDVFTAEVQRRSVDAGTGAHTGHSVLLPGFLIETGRAASFAYAALSRQNRSTATPWSMACRAWSHCVPD